jgi:protein-tyrosine kinase
MGRIDEALRRAGTGPGPGIAAILPTEPASSPWGVSGGANGSTPDDASAEAAAADAMAAEDALAATSILPVENIPPTALLDDAPQAGVAGFSAEWADRLALSPNVSPALVEQFRRLAASLFSAQGNGALKVIMVTSAAPGDGKTMTAVNLALILSESYGRNVLLIDADLRRPSINNLTPRVPTCGLSDGLKAKDDQKLSVLQVTDRLTLLPAGRPDPDPMSGLTSIRMRRIIEEASNRFEWVILDAPPVGPLADASLLAGIADAILFVIRAGTTPYTSIQKAIEAVGREKIFGVVLNGVQPGTQDDYEENYGKYRNSMADAVRQ